MIPDACKRMFVNRPRSTIVWRMTWVIGISGLLNGAAVMGDTAITLEYGDGRRGPADFGVQKIHPVAPWMVVGFAGPVDLGLQVVGDLGRWLGPLEDGWGWRPGRVVWHWSRRLRFVWRRMPPAPYRGRPLELMLVGAGPANPTPLASTFGWILRAPAFALEPIPPQSALSIGSGASATPYREALRAPNRMTLPSVSGASR